MRFNVSPAQRRSPHRRVVTLDGPNPRCHYRHVAISSKLLNEGERVIVSTRTHPKALIGPVLVAVVVIAAAVVAASFVSAGSTILYAAIVAVAAALLLGLVVPPVLRWAGTTYTFTNHRFIKRSGLIAKEGRTIPLNRISGVDFEIGIIDRLFGCGTLIVSDASTHGQVELKDIPRVESVQLKVAEELARQSGRPDGA